MTRWTLAGCMALAALGAVAVLDVGSSTAEAAPSVSPFAGTYASGTITISDGGRITGSYYGFSLSGRVSADGSYSITESETHYYYDERRGQTRRRTSRDTFGGNMALDPDGNIVGTIDPDYSNTNGGSFFWLRQ